MVVEAALLTSICRIFRILNRGEGIKTWKRTEQNLRTLVVQDVCVCVYTHRTLVKSLEGLILSANAWWNEWMNINVLALRICTFTVTLGIYMIVVNGWSIFTAKCNWIAPKKISESTYLTQEDFLSLSTTTTKLHCVCSDYYVITMNWDSNNNDWWGERVVDENAFW